jgi:transcriptional regulator with XRE-family HTH domain
MIADRIRQARLAAGLTLGGLGEQVGVSHTAIQKFEKGLLTPSSSQLLKLARACGIRTEYFFRNHTVELLQPEFRKLSTFGKTAQDALKIKVIELVEKRVELLGTFPESPLLAFAPPAGLHENMVSLDAIEAFTDRVRNAWQLGMNPIADLTDTLEGLGLLVIVVDEENQGFSGLTATARTEAGRE